MSRHRNAGDPARTGRALRTTCLGLALPWMLLSAAILDGLVGTFGGISLPAIVIVNVPPFLPVLPATAAALTYVWRRRPAAAVLCATAALLFVYPLGGFAWSCSSARLAPEALTVVQYNVEKWSHGAGSVALALRGLSADVLCLEEAGRYGWLTEDDQTPEALMRGLPEYRFERAGEIMIGTRLEVVARRAIPLPDAFESRPLLDVVLDRGGRPFSVFAVHLQPAGSGSATGRSFRGGVVRRLAQISAIRTHAASLTHPIVLCGDFNAPPRSRELASLRESFVDSWEARGTGFGVTESNSLLSRRIDYVMTRRMRVIDIAVRELGISDHRGVVARVAFD